MTDKEKIRREIEKRYEYWREKEHNSHSIESETRMSECQHLLLLFNSLQEEPVSVWHNMEELPIKGEVIVVQTKDTFYGLSVQKGGSTYKNRNKERYVRWAYASDLLNLSNVQRDAKNWKEPVSNDLEEAANDYAHDLVHDDVFETFIDGALWQKEHLWKDAQGDDLPEIDKEVIALVRVFPEGHDDLLKVSFAHRPQEYWDGKNIATGEVTRYYPKRYDKGGWSIPDVKFWLDCELPKIKE